MATLFERMALQLQPDRLRWAVRVRWLVIGGFLVLALVARALGVFDSSVAVVQAAVAGAILNAVNGWCVRRGRWVVAVTAVALPLDHLLSTYVVLSTGGAASPFLFLYIVAVLAAAMLVGTAAAAGSAVLAIVLWVAGNGLQAAEYIGPPPAVGNLAVLQQPWLFQAVWGAFLLYCLALLVVLGGYVAERLRASEHDLADRNRRLEAALASIGTAHAELRCAHRRLQHTQAQLVHAEKMRGLGELVAGVAHELNNPLSFVSANLPHLRDGMRRLGEVLDAYAALPLPDELCQAIAARSAALGIDRVRADLPELLDDCEEGARRSAEIVRGLRTFAHSDERDAWALADVHRGLDGTLALLASRLRGRIAVHRDFGDLPLVECLPGPMHQVFMNLLANAADALGPHGGNIWISTRLRDDAPVPTIAIAIRDDGPGIPTAVQARLFEPFFTTKPAGQGIGLGLSISYAIVQRHGGTVAVESRPGAGTTFTVTLPVQRSPSAANCA